MLVSSNVKRLSKHKIKNGLIRHHNAKHVVTEINNIKPSQCSTSTSIDDVKTVVNIVTHDNLIELLKETQKDLSVHESVMPELRDAIKNAIFLILTISYYLSLKRYRKSNKKV